MFSKALNVFFCYCILLLSIDVTEVYSQTPKEIKKEVSPSDNTSIRVTKLEKPSLGSLGFKTGVNDKLGLDIWQNMKASDIIEHSNYIPDILSSRYLHIFLSDLYLSYSKPPAGNSDNIIKFLESMFLKIKWSWNSKKLYQLVN